MSSLLRQHFGANLRSLRESVGISQEELGFRASLHRTEVSELERGIRLPKLDAILKLSAALSIPAGELVAGMVWIAGGFSPQQQNGERK